MKLEACLAPTGDLVMSPLSLPESDSFDSDLDLGSPSDAAPKDPPSERRLREEPSRENTQSPLLQQLANLSISDKV